MFPPPARGLTEDLLGIRTLVKTCNGTRLRQLWWHPFPPACRRCTILSEACTGELGALVAPTCGPRSKPPNDGVEAYPLAGSSCLLDGGKSHRSTCPLQAIGRHQAIHIERRGRRDRLLPRGGRTISPTSQPPSHNFTAPSDFPQKIPDLPGFELGQTVLHLKYASRSRTSVRICTLRISRCPSISIP